jgi:hypothetical protein
MLRLTEFESSDSEYYCDPGLKKEESKRVIMETEPEPEMLLEKSNYECDVLLVDDNFFNIDVIQ